MENFLGSCFMLTENSRTLGTNCVLIKCRWKVDLSLIHVNGVVWIVKIEKGSVCALVDENRNPKRVGTWIWWVLIVGLDYGWCEDELLSELE